MKVTYKRRNEVSFDTLRPGDTFMDDAYDETTVFVVIQESVDITIKPDDCTTEFYGYAAAINDTGIVYGYKADEKVIPVEVELLITL